MSSLVGSMFIIGGSLIFVSATYVAISIRSYEKYTGSNGDTWLYLIVGLALGVLVFEGGRSTFKNQRRKLLIWECIFLLSAIAWYAILGAV